MICPKCNDRGFVTFSGDFKSPRTGVVTKNVEQVRRCPEYVRYFRSLQIDVGVARTDKKFNGSEVVEHHRLVESDRWKRQEAYASEEVREGCGAAVARHRQIMDQVRSKLAERAAEGKAARKGRGKDVW